MAFYCSKSISTSVVMALLLTACDGTIVSDPFPDDFCTADYQFPNFNIKYTLVGDQSDRAEIRVTLRDEVILDSCHIDQPWQIVRNPFDQIESEGVLTAVSEFAVRDIQYEMRTAGLTSKTENLIIEYRFDCDQSTPTLTQSSSIEIELRSTCHGDIDGRSIDISDAAIEIFGKDQLE
jgi:hypothetical protein